MSFIFSQRSKNNLQEVNSKLIQVVTRALELTSVDFAVTEGVRTLARQKDLMKDGKSKTLDSRHLTGHAIDVVAYVDGKISWESAPYFKIAEAMKQASKELKIPITWGGDWQTFKDYVHFELNKNFYPV